MTLHYIECESDEATITIVVVLCVFVVCKLRSQWIDLLVIAPQS